jgi:hypothetical protein
MPGEKTRVPPGWPISVPVVGTGLHSPSLRTPSVSMGIEVEGLTKRHRDEAGRDGLGDGLGDGEAGHGARPAPVACVHTMPIRARS